jgi:crotonobetaine/carnitine-CoA ligase
MNEPGGLAVLTSAASVDAVLIGQDAVTGQDAVLTGSGWAERDIPLTVPALLRRRAEQRGDAPLLRVGPVRLSYRQTAERAAGMAGALAARGIRAGDRVAALCGNRIELLELFLGCAWLGAVVVPLNTALRGASLRDPLHRARANALLVERTMCDEALAVAGPLPLWVLDADAAAPDPASAGLIEAGLIEAAPIEAAPIEAAPIEPAPVAPGDTVAILFTSGTTGPSRGVCCPHGQLVQWGRTVGRALELTPDDVLHTNLPLFHTNALNAFLQAVVAGASFSLGTRFSASRFFTDAADAGATVTYLLGAMVNMVMSGPPSPADRAHRVTKALAPASPENLCVPFAERFGVRLVDGFGTTETNLVLGTGVGQARPGSLGQVVDGFTARVVDERGRDAPDGQPGELLVRTALPYGFASGYWDDPEHTAERFRDGWFHTGDRVVRDGDGWFRFVDRIKDVIRRRGENISSYEVEQVLLRHPGVSEAAVFAVPSELAEDEVMAVLVPTPDNHLDLAEVAAHCTRELPYFAVPRYLELADALPKTPTGKVRKHHLRLTGVTPQTWDRHPAGRRSQHTDSALSTHQSEGRSQRPESEAT